MELHGNASRVAEAVREWAQAGWSVLSVVNTGPERWRLTALLRC